MTDEMAERTVVSLATVRELAGARLGALARGWAAAAPGTAGEARLDGAIDELEGLCRDLGAGTAEIREDGSVSWG